MAKPTTIDLEKGTGPKPGVAVQPSWLGPRTGWACLNPTPPESEPTLPAVIDQHYQDVYRYALMVSCSSHDAADLTQYAFTQFMSRTKPLKDPSRAKSYLFRTVYNQFMDQIKQRNRHTSMETMDEAPEHSAPASQATLTDARLVLEAMGGLDPEVRRILFLHYHDGLTCIEISKSLSLPFGTVASRLSRGKNRLRRAMGIDPDHVTMQKDPSNT